MYGDGCTNCSNYLKGFTSEDPRKFSVQYHIVLYNRNGDILCHKVIIEGYQTELLDAAFKAGEKIQIDEIAFKIGSDIKQ